MHDPGFHSWRRHVFYRSEHVRTTWKFRLGLTGLVILLAWVTSGWWTAAIARGLICERDVAPSDAILVDNFDPDYRLFERAARLRRSGIAPRVLIPVPADEHTLEASPVARAITQLLVDLSRVGPVEMVPVRAIEPISLNAAIDLRTFLVAHNIRSVVVVSPLFRSRRSDLVYDAVLERRGIVVRCEAVEEARDIRSWTNTWHGMQDVVEQWAKLQYYKLWVLPFHRAHLQ
jgi:hypothetical protein